eukprot:2015575-Amphidinium_carterae.1
MMLPTALPSQATVSEGFFLKLPSEQICHSSTSFDEVRKGEVWADCRRGEVPLLEHGVRLPRNKLRLHC